MNKLKRITLDPTVMGGKPCIRGVRVTVGTIIGLMAAGRSEENILEVYPYLEKEDLSEALEHKRRQETQEALDSANQGRVIDGDAVHQWLQSWGTDDELPPPMP